GTHSERAPLHRLRLDSALRACPRPLHVWFHDNTVTAAVYSPDGNAVAVAADKSVQLRDAGTGRSLAEPLRHERRVLTVTFSKNGKRLTTVCGDPADVSKDHTIDYFIRVWDARSGKPLTPPLRHVLLVADLPSDLAGQSYPQGEFAAAEAERVALAPDPGSVQICDVGTGKV